MPPLDENVRELDKETRKLISEAEKAAYAKAIEDERLRNRPPLFEACKLYCRQNWKSTPDKLKEAIGWEDGQIDIVGTIEEEYGGRLSTADRNLCLAQSRRKKAEVQKLARQRDTGSITEYAVVQ